jgi:hypothetical protein
MNDTMGFIYYMFLVRNADFYNVGGEYCRWKYDSIVDKTDRCSLDVPNNWKSWPTLCNYVVKNDSYD